MLQIRSNQLFGLPAGVIFFFRNVLNQAMPP